MLYQPNRETQISVQVIPQWEAIPDDFYREHRPANRSVKDELANEVDYWRPECPVLIEAQTGLGKTTFVYETLIPKALEQHKNVLIISNRIAISVQQKIRIMEMTGDRRRDLLTDLGIQKCEDFGAIRVITYHRLHELLKDKDFTEWRERLLYVVADEAHFFTSDALFNRHCSYILRNLTTRFCHAIRIYMTATSWEVLKPLGEAERDNYSNFLGAVTGTITRDRCFHRYIFPFDYSTYDLHFIKSLDELTEPIKKARSEKWIVFCDSRAKGKDFSGKLGESASYIDADTKESKVWNELMKNEHFDTQVLVTTAVLDCGVNIRDRAVKNIVICTDNRTSLFQMAGRKRLDSQETVTVWVVEPDKKALSGRAMQYKRQLDLIRKFDLLQTQRERSSFLNWLLEKGSPAENNLFYTWAMWHPDKSKEHMQLQKNKLAEYVLTRRKAFLADMLSGKANFREEVRAWFGKPPEIPTNVLDGLDKFYQDWGEKALPPEQVKALRSLIVNLCKQAGYDEPQKTRIEQLQSVALNNRLSKTLNAPYHIKTIPEKEWVLTRCNPQETN